MSGSHPRQSLQDHFISEGIIPGAARIVILEMSISGNYLQDEKLNRERKLNGLLSITEIGRFEKEQEQEDKEKKRMRVC